MFRRFRPWVLGTVTAAVVVGVVVLTLGGAALDFNDQPATPPSTTEVAESSEQSDVGSAEATSTTPSGRFVRPVADGMIGDDVARVQQRLIELGLNPGPVDGVFGPLTLQAVWTFEKLALDIPTGELRGVVTDEMWERMQEPLIVSPNRPSGVGTTHIEIDLTHQVLVVFEDDEAVVLSHISSGDDHEWCETVTYDTDVDGIRLEQSVEDAFCGVSRTPGGVFTVSHVVEGTWRTPLGPLVNPIYSNEGIAIHGSEAVPDRPISRGDVRVPIPVSERLMDVVDVGDRVFVWDGEHEPEDVTGEQMRPQLAVQDGDVASSPAALEPDTIPSTSFEDG